MHTKGCTEIYEAFELLAAKDIDDLSSQAVTIVFDLFLLFFVFSLVLQIFVV